jgi:hypothetical protein
MIFLFICLSALSTRHSTLDTRPFSLAHLVSSVIYHAARNKGKCDLHGGRRQGLVEWEGQNQPEIELMLQPHPPSSGQELEPSEVHPEVILEQTRRWMT